jgi:hypothetical protein
MLRLRDHQGYSVAQHFRTNAKRYLFFGVYFGALLGITVYIQWWTACAAIGGVVFGCLLRDFAWVSSAKKSWQFSLEIIDWQKVEKLADEKSMA